MLQHVMLSLQIHVFCSPEQNRNATCTLNTESDEHDVEHLLGMDLTLVYNLPLSTSHDGNGGHVAVLPNRTGSVNSHSVR